MKRKIIPSLLDIWKCYKIGMITTIIIIIPTVLAGVIQYHTNIMEILNLIKTTIIIAGAVVLLFGGIDLHKSIYLQNKQHKISENIMEQKNIKEQKNIEVDALKRENYYLQQKFSIFNFSSIFIIIAFVILLNGCILDWILSIN